MVRPRSKSN